MRTSGCNLRCWFCDTPFASWDPVGELLTHEEIVEQLDHLQAQHVVLTGGEPLLPNSIVDLTQKFSRQNFHITIETAGTVYRPVFCDLISISPKLASSTPSSYRRPLPYSQTPVAVTGLRIDPHGSAEAMIRGQDKAHSWQARHDHQRHQPDVIRQWVKQYSYQIKFVIDQPADCIEVEQYLLEFPEIARDRVLLMPQGIELSELEKKRNWLEPYCQLHGLTFCPRKHIEWYGNRRGT